ncbi:MAG TPA: hypothetical protein VEA59_05925 [Patescibacteria group bacterium]|nr:hypothetical protein [Patescibacteria group bacterium]
MPKTVYVIPYANGRPGTETSVPVVADQHVALLQISTLDLRKRGLTEPDEEAREFFYEQVARVLFTWPWYYLRPEVLQGLFNESGTWPWGAWRIEVYRQVIKDIQSGELTNTWKSPYVKEAGGG